MNRHDELDLIHRAAERARRAENERLRTALRNIAALQTTEPQPDDGYCGCVDNRNFDDAHDHGRDLGKWQAAQMARAESEATP